MATSNVERLAQRRRAEATLPAFWQHGFRPFFLIGALFAALAMLAWPFVLEGRLALPTALEPVAWHRHEMLFGWLPAIVAAFLLTAIPNWTGRLPVRGWRLAALVGVWLAARTAVLGSAVWGAWPGLVLEQVFLVGLAATAAREIIAGGNRRNLPVVALVGLIAVAALLSHLQAVDVAVPELLGERIGIAAVAMLVALIGGRIVPSFTTNWLRARGETRLPAAFALLDRATLVLTAAALLAWIAAPAATGSGVLLLAAGTATLVRLGRWRGLATLREPLLTILHLGIAWLALGLAAQGAAALGWIPRTVALHVLTAGAFGTMTLAVMTRATLGHTGRKLTADRSTVLIYALVIAGALARFAAELPSLPYTPMIHAAAALWGGAFLLFVLRYGRMLLGPRAAPSSP